MSGQVKFNRATNSGLPLVSDPDSLTVCREVTGSQDTDYSRIYLGDDLIGAGHVFLEGLDGLVPGPEIPSGATGVYTDSHFLRIDGGWYVPKGVVYSAECTSAANENKLINGFLNIEEDSSYAPSNGDVFCVKFTYSNTKENPQIIFPGTAATTVPIKLVSGTAAGTTPATSWEAGSTVLMMYSSSDSCVYMVSKPEKQSDWNETVSTDPAFIVNKPSIRTGVGEKSIVEGSTVTNESIGNWSHSEGVRTIAYSNASHAEGLGTQDSILLTSSTDEGSTDKDYQVFIGAAMPIVGNVIGYNGNYVTVTATHENRKITLSETLGTLNGGLVKVFTSSAKGFGSHIEGESTMTNNEAEHAEGQYNVSSSGSTSADQTISTIGIGTANNARKNAVDVRLNGDVYIDRIGNYNGTGNAEPLQDVISGIQNDITSVSGDIKTYTIEEDRSSHQTGVGTQYNLVNSDGDTCGDTITIPSKPDWKEDVSSNLDYINNRPNLREGEDEGIIEGNISDNVSEGEYAHAEGDTTFAMGDNSHTEGNLTIAQGDNAHAEGLGVHDTLGLTGSDVIYTVDGDVPNGIIGTMLLYQGTVATVLFADRSQITLDTTLGTFGKSTDVTWLKSGAIGNNSHVEGEGTIALNSNEHAQGQYNVSNTGKLNTIHSIGIGRDDAHRQNAVEVLKDGNVFVYGVGDYNGEDPGRAASLQSLIGGIIASIHQYTIASTTPDTGYLTAYQLKQDGSFVGAKINIPKDFLVKSGDVIDVVEYNGEYYDATDIEHENPLPVTAAGKYLDFVVNTADTSGGSATDQHIYILVSDLVDVYTGGNGVTINSSNVVSLDLTANGGLQFSGSTEGSKTVGLKLDSSNSNGLSIGSGGLSLATVTASTNGSGGSNGAMLATDKEKLDGIATGAEVNVQSDWEQDTTTADDYIKNKPSIRGGIGSNSIVEGGISSNEALDSFSHSEGRNTLAFSNSAHAEGSGEELTIILVSSTDEGATDKDYYLFRSTYVPIVGNVIKYNDSYATVTTVSENNMITLSETFGTLNRASARILTNTAKGNNSHTEGSSTMTNNDSEHAEGKYNVSNTGSTNAEKTISSIGIGTSNTARKNAFEVMLNGDVYLLGIGSYDGTTITGASTLQSVISTASESCENLTYAQLVAKVDDLQLVPGKEYRITDYNCTTTQQNTSSAYHQFDIIVTADSTSTLNENARAAQHTGVSYFADCDLDAWELKYSLDNDRNRFAWASPTSYPSLDIEKLKVDYDQFPQEFQDFIVGNDIDYEDDEVGFFYNETIGHNRNYLFSPDNGQSLYTEYYVELYDDVDYALGDSVIFSAISDTTECEITSINGSSELPGKGVIYYMKDEYGNVAPFDFKNIRFTRSSQWFYNNHEWTQDVLGSSFSGEDTDFYFLSWVNEDGEVEDASIVCQTLMNDEDSYSGVYGNEIKETTAYSMSLTEDATSTTFALPCTIIVNSYAYDEGFFYGCYSNKFGNDCVSNSFGNNCFQNSFGNGCFQNSFWNDCGSNSFGNYCQVNTFGNTCSDNSFGNNCQFNSFGNYFQNNSFGNNCYRNSFGNYCQHITVFDGVQHCIVTGGSQSATVKNAQILNGVAGTSQTSRLTITFAQNKTYTQIAALKEDPTGNLTPAQRLVIWDASKAPNDSDLVHKSGEETITGAKIFDTANIILDNASIKFFDERNGEDYGPYINGFYDSVTNVPSIEFMGSYGDELVRLTNVADPVHAQDVATKNFVTSQGYTTNVGTVTGVKVGTSGSTIDPDASGVVTIPEYPTIIFRQW